MRNVEVPVYVFTGFMDSGKTSLIKETLFINGFAYDLKRFLVILTEEGDEEIDEDELYKLGGSLEIIEDVSEFTGEKLVEFEKEYVPEAVFIEMNGTWNMDSLFEMGDAPENWVIAQVLTTVDSNTFEMYMQNMRNLMVEVLRKSEVVIFNRFTDKFPKSRFRANVKSINRPTQIVYERPDHSIDDEPEELPFDVTKDELNISDADYGIWFMDAMDHPEKYDGKTVSFLGLVYNPKNKEGALKNGTIVPGRFAMTCCADDIQFLGLKCVSEEANKNVLHKSWVNIKAKVKAENCKEYDGPGPVLYPLSIEPAEKPEDELVYFN